MQKIKYGFLVLVLAIFIIPNSQAFSIKLAYANTRDGYIDLDKMPDTCACGASFTNCTCFMGIASDPSVFEPIGDNGHVMEATMEFDRDAGKIILEWFSRTPLKKNEEYYFVHNFIFKKDDLKIFFDDEIERYLPMQKAKVYKSNNNYKIEIKVDLVKNIKKEKELKKPKKIQK